jgi:hypothetical protein
MDEATPTTRQKALEIEPRRGDLSHLRGDRGGARQGRFELADGGTIFPEIDKRRFRAG